MEELIKLLIEKLEESTATEKQKSSIKRKIKEAVAVCQNGTDFDVDVNTGVQIAYKRLFNELTELRDDDTKTAEFVKLQNSRLFVQYGIKVVTE